jgi:hypothetical protein
MINLIPLLLQEDGKCDYPVVEECGVSNEGDNHRGYMGWGLEIQQIKWS